MGLPSLDNIPSVADLTASFAARKEERLKQEAEKKEGERRVSAPAPRQKSRSILGDAVDREAPRNLQSLSFICHLKLFLFGLISTFRLT